MRILKENDVERKRRCKYCKNLIAYSPKDIKEWVDKYVVCPICGSDVWISIFDRKVKKR